jgi:hypothetical protein
MIRPKHVVAIIYVLVYISGLIGQYFFISLQVLNLFDLDDLLNKSVIEKMGLKLVGIFCVFLIQISFDLKNHKIYILKHYFPLTDCPWRKCENRRLGLLAEWCCAVVDS